jgi:hypothetical protein
MVAIRPTRKLRSALPVTQVVGLPDTALGDWYANRFVVGRQPLLLLVSSTSLLSILVRARRVRELPNHLEDMVACRLVRLGVATPLIDAERRAMRPARIGPTVDRSVLGIMADFANSVPYYLEAGGLRDSALVGAENRLAGTPCYAGKASDRVVFPDRRALELLVAKWAG